MDLREDRKRQERVIAYLAHIRDIQREAWGKQDRLAHLRALAEGVSAAGGESVSGGKGRDLADIQAEIDQLADEYAADVERYRDEIAHGYELCPPSNVPRYVCWLHWAEGLSWPQVAAKVRYTPSHCAHNLSDRGIDEIYEAMPHVWREPEKKTEP